MTICSGIAAYPQLQGFCFSVSVWFVPPESDGIETDYDDDDDDDDEDYDAHDYDGNYYVYVRLWPHVKKLTMIITTTTVIMD